MRLHIFLLSAMMTHTAWAQLKSFRVTSNGVPMVTCGFGSESAVNGCIFDTGASVTVIPPELKKVSQGFKVTKTTEGKGVGCKTTCEELEVPNITVDGIPMPVRKLLRCEPFRKDGLIGINIIDKKIWKFDFAKDVVDEENKIPEELKRHPLFRDGEGRMYINVKVAGQEVLALVDTGYSENAITPQFIKNHPGVFKFDHDIALSSACGKLPFKAYRGKKGQLEINGFHDGGGALFLSQNLSKIGIEAIVKMKPDMVLGFRAIQGLKWHFDLKNNQWAAELLD